MTTNQREVTAVGMKRCLENPENVCSSERKTIEEKDMKHKFILITYIKNEKDGKDTHFAVIRNSYQLKKILHDSIRGYGALSGMIPLHVIEDYLKVNGDKQLVAIRNFMDIETDEDVRQLSPILPFWQHPDDYKYTGYVASAAKFFFIYHENPDVFETMMKNVVKNFKKAIQEDELTDYTYRKVHFEVIEKWEYFHNKDQKALADVIKNSGYLVNYDDIDTVHKWKEFKKSKEIVHSFKKESVPPAW